MPGALASYSPKSMRFPCSAAKAARSAPMVSGMVPNHKSKNHQSLTCLCRNVLSQNGYRSVWAYRKSQFRAGFRRDSNRQHIKLGPPAGPLSAGGPILKLCRLEPDRNPARKSEILPGEAVARSPVPWTGRKGGSDRPDSGGASAPRVKPLPSSLEGPIRPSTPFQTGHIYIYTPRLMEPDSGGASAPRVKPPPP